MLQVETYRLQDQTSLQQTRDENDAAKKREELCATLGLQAQKTLDGSIDPALFYEELQGFELRIWLEFLPTWYSKKNGAWTQYTFDIIPNSVLEEIRLAQELKIFFDLEIWTPERQSDPLAVGVVGNHQTNRRDGNARFFKIARWGESLRSFEQITNEVMKRYFHNWTNELLSPALKDLIVKIAKEKNIDHVFVEKNRFFPRHCGKQTYRICSLYQYRSLQNICGVCLKSV